MFAYPYSPSTHTIAMAQITLNFGLELELLLGPPRNKSSSSAFSSWKLLAKDLSKRLATAGIPNHINDSNDKSPHNYREWSITQEITIPSQPDKGLCTSTPLLHPFSLLNSLLTQSRLGLKSRHRTSLPNFFLLLLPPSTPRQPPNNLFRPHHLLHRPPLPKHLDARPHFSPPAIPARPPLLGQIRPLLRVLPRPPHAGCSTHRTARISSVLVPIEPLQPLSFGVIHRAMLINDHSILRN